MRNGRIYGPVEQAYSEKFIERAIPLLKIKSEIRSKEYLMTIVKGFFISFKSIPKAGTLEKYKQTEKIELSRKSSGIRNVFFFEKSKKFCRSQNSDKKVKNVVDSFNES